MSARKHAGWRLCFIAVAMIAGFITGLLLRGSVSSAVGASFGNSGEGMRTGDSQSIKESASRKRAIALNARDTRDSMVFSRLQWSKLIRNPKLMNITLLEYLPRRESEDSAPVIDDIPLLARLFGPQNPEGLRQAADFFGWDEKQVGSVASALGTFGRNLAEAEKVGARMEDLESGGIRFDLSASRERRQELADQLKVSLTEIVGTKDAGRFFHLVDMEGLSRPVAGDYVITVEVRNGYFGIDAPGVKEFLAPVDASESLDLLPILASSGLDRRIEHLGFQIDWSRYVPTATTRESGWK